jgi:hypothetical protein
MNQIAPVTVEAAAEPAVSDSLLNFVARAMTNPKINADKLEALLRMQRQIVADDAKLRFNRAMSAAQAEMTPVVRDARNSQTNSRYASLDAIDAAIRPIYTRHGFCLSFNSEPIEHAGIRIVCEVSHEAGHSRTYQLESALDTIGPLGKANKTPLHGLGSAVSYLRRYLTGMIFHVVLTNEDTDGNPPPPPAASYRLTHAQCMDLKGLMRETHTLESRFLDVMCPGLTVIAEAPAGEFHRLKNALIAKRTQLTRRQGEAA